MLCVAMRTRTCPATSVASVGKMEIAPPPILFCNLMFSSWNVPVHSVWLDALLDLPISYMDQPA